MSQDFYGFLIINFYYSGWGLFRGVGSQKYKNTEYTTRTQETTHKFVPVLIFGFAFSPTLYTISRTHNTQST